MTEATLTKNIRLTIVKRGGWARKTHGGPHMKGWLDLVAVYRGYSLFLEVKLPTNRKGLTKLQAETIRQLRAAGAIAMEVRSTEEVRHILDKIDKVRDEHKLRTSRKGTANRRSTKTKRRRLQPA